MWSFTVIQQESEKGRISCFEQFFVRHSVEFLMKLNFAQSQCGKFSTFLSLRFYVKSILENVKVQKMSFLPFQELWNYDFGTFQPSANAKIHEKARFRASKWVRIIIYGPQKFLKLISRKIWVEKFTLTQKTFCESNSLVTTLVSALISRNFCEKSVRINFSNFHTVCW